LNAAGDAGQLTGKLPERGDDYDDRWDGTDAVGCSRSIPPVTHRYALYNHSAGTMVGCSGSRVPRSRDRMECDSGEIVMVIPRKLYAEKGGAQRADTPIQPAFIFRFHLSV